MISLTHELADAFVYLDYKFLVSPHGKEWKHTFKKMMLNFLNTSCFPDDVLRILSKHLISPKASTMSDFKLAYVLNKYNFSNELLLYVINYGRRFSISNWIFGRSTDSRHDDCSYVRVLHGACLYNRLYEK